MESEFKKELTKAFLTFHLNFLLRFVLMGRREMNNIATGFAAYRPYQYMKTRFTLLLSLCLSFLFAQEIERKSVVANRTALNIKVDGEMDESDWAEAEIATDFIQFDPDNGAPMPSEFKTEVRILYDEAIYFSAKMNDPSPDSILRELGKRDDLGRNTSWFAVWINPYNDGQNDINFWVTAAGVQIDSRTTVNGDDIAWGTVWRSATKITDYGWAAEIKLPYSALRMPKVDKHLMGLNLGRQIRRKRQLLYRPEKS